MDAGLSRKFVEKRVSHLKSFPISWDVPQGHYYCLDIRMCHIKTLSFDATLYSDREHFLGSSLVTSIFDKVLVLDVAVNEVTALDQNSVLPFKNLRKLDATLNKIAMINGLEVVSQLHTLILSQNMIRSLEGLNKCWSLVELDLSRNELEDITSMPNLLSLEVLNISYNKIKSLDGIQYLPRLRDLHFQNNYLKRIIPISGCFYLKILDGANNQLSDLEELVTVLKGLTELSVLTLYGNPISKDVDYQSKLISFTSISMLDNVNMKPVLKSQDDDHVSIKEAAKQTCDGHLQAAHQRMEETVQFLYKRILAVQTDYENYKKRKREELEIFLRYLDSMSNPGLELETNGWNECLETKLFKGKKEEIVRKKLASPFGPDFLSHPKGHHNDAEGNRNVKDTDELMRCVYNKLLQEQTLNR